MISKTASAAAVLALLALAGHTRADLLVTGRTTAIRSRMLLRADEAGPVAAPESFNPDSVAAPRAASPDLHALESNGASPPPVAASPADPATPSSEDPLAASLAKKVHQSGNCDQFWSNDFNKIIDKVLGKSNPLDCGTQDPGFGDNQAMADSIKDQLSQSGCAAFEAVVWDGTHGHDHQGANVRTYQTACDGGMSGNPPGPHCGEVGGTYHGFCTGYGKSYGIFIKPHGAEAAGTGSAVTSLAQQCDDKANLLIDFTKCVQKGGVDEARLQGVIALPTKGIPGRPNHYATTFSCDANGWISCQVLTLEGRQLTIFAVNFS